MSSRGISHSIRARREARLRQSQTAYCPSICSSLAKETSTVLQLALPLFTAALPTSAASVKSSWAEVNSSSSAATDEVSEEAFSVAAETLSLLIVSHAEAAPIDRKSTRLNSSHPSI